MKKRINIKTYKLGDKRSKRKFLLFPMILKNKNNEYEKRWLEYAEWEEVVCSVYTEGLNPTIKYGWYSKRWLN
jgi:hypothetical protein